MKIFCLQENEKKISAKELSETKNHTLGHRNGTLFEVDRAGNPTNKSIFKGTTAAPMNGYFEIVCLFVLGLNIQVNNFSVMSGRSHYFLGITSTFWSKVSCSRTQHGGSRFRTPNLSLRGLSHRALCYYEMKYMYQWYYLNRLL